MKLFYLLLLCLLVNVIADDVPESFDWRKQKAILSSPQTGVICSSIDWAFAIVTAVESQLFLTNGTLEPLSPQYVLDCCSFSDGCNTGPSLKTAYECLERNGGLSSHYSYFNGKQGACFGGANLPISYNTWNGVTEEYLKELLFRRGPLNVVIDASNLKSYSGGIWNASNCNDGTNRQPWAVTLVGYSYENDVDYWIIKNWWGSSWGENGYLRLLRNKNACGITNTVFVPIVLV